jgi:outer membrane protein OmpA-like peptidoglycan-associated protein
MAEVFLLLLFTLLIALAAVWNADRQRDEARDDHHQEPPQILSAADRHLFDEFKNAMGSASPDSVMKALNDLRNGEQLEPMNKAEKDFVTEVRRQLSGDAPDAISDQWRQLTRAARNPKGLGKNLDVAEEVKRTLPEDKDRSRVGSIIQQGLEAEKQGGHDWPPIINVREAKDCFFETGKAELTPCFEKRLQETVPELLALAHRYNVSTIEIIGHTDEQKIVPRASNLDASLLGVLHQTASVSSLVPADNAGLGLARAAAVVRVLTLDERLSGYTLLPLSGGQLIGVDDKLTKGGGGDEQERRRIEIRVRRGNSAEASADSSPLSGAGPAGQNTNAAASSPVVGPPPAAAPRPAAAPSPARVTLPPARAPSPPVRAVAPPARAVSPPPQPSQPRDRAVAPWFLFGMTSNQAEGRN